MAEKRLIFLSASEVRLALTRYAHHIGYHVEPHAWIISEDNPDDGEACAVGPSEIVPKAKAEPDPKPIT